MCKINKFTQLTIYRIRITIFVCPIILEITLTPENIFTHKVNNNNRSFSIYRKKKNWLKNLSKTVIEPIINSFSWLTIISLIRDGRGCKDGIINTERNDIRRLRKAKHDTKNNELHRASLNPIYTSLSCKLSFLFCIA